MAGEIAALNARCADLESRVAELEDLVRSLMDAPSTGKPYDPAGGVAEAREIQIMRQIDSGRSQREVAEEFGISQTSVSRIVRARREAEHV